MDQHLRKFLWGSRSDIANFSLRFAWRKQIVELEESPGLTRDRWRRVDHTYAGSGDLLDQRDDKWIMRAAHDDCIDALFEHWVERPFELSLIHISEPTRLRRISY